MRKKSTNGYKDNSSNKYKDNLIINSNNITMDGVSQKLMAVELDKDGKIIGTKFMKPNNGEYNFPKAQNIMEIPQYKKGGKQKLYTQDYQIGNEPPINETNYLPSYLYGQQQETVNTGLGPVGTQGQATHSQQIPAVTTQQTGVTQKQTPNKREQLKPILNSTASILFEEGMSPDEYLKKQVEKGADENEEYLQRLVEDGTFENREGVKLTNNPNIQFFNQYQGVDIPTAAYTLGTSIESGDTLGTVASSLKLATGLGRNIMGGVGQQKQYKRQQQDYYEKVGEHDPANSFERGGQYQDDLSNYMSMIDPTDPTDPKDKKLTPEQVKALNEKSGVEFTEEGANSIFEQMPDPMSKPVAPKLDLGKYKDVGYFDSNYNELTGEYDVRPTKNNPSNAALYKDNLRYLQKMNPNLKINTRGHESGYIARGQREEFEKGGQYQGDEYRMGLDEDMLTNQQKQLLNAETEAGEYIKDPNTEKVSEIVGDKHSQGGEKMIMKQGEKVLTDHTKLGAKNAKYIKETYDIDVKAKNTYSDALDKIRSKTGLKKLVQEEEDYLKKLENLSDKDKVTGSINTKFLEEKLGEVRAKKEPLEKVRQTIFDDLYRIQEEEKQVAEYQEEFQKGGEKISKEEAQRRLKAKEIESLGSGQYIQRGKEQILNSYRQTWDRNKFPKFEDYVNAAEKWKAENPDWNRKTKDRLYYTQEKAVDVLSAGLAPYDTSMTMEDIQNAIAHLIPNQDDETSQEGVEQDVDDSQVDDNTQVQKTRTPRNIALLPNQYPMAPNSLEPTIKENTRYERFDPSLIDQTIYLENLQRQELQAERRMEGLPPQLRQAALANLDANMARANADTMLKIDAQNINSKNRAEEMNTRIANRQVDANNRDRLMFEGRALTAKSNTDIDYQNYFNKGTEVNLQNYKNINALNRSNATHDVQFDGQNYIKSNAPDFSKYYEMTQQLAKYQQKEKDAEKKKKTKK